ncbi:hypothetical protein GU90_07985 [Saccharopolyspora rectivirgula]|uniref:Uncharacterized protein n=1 Tax=Saccharopolyspora rectivirgula TaxID=28042 RepID=A0A073AY89_9PSEU|nr:hypothetical protein GU90_07985 [Saccharopolyspora rectivirgula]
MYFCDAAFAPHAAQRAQDSTDDDSLSLLIGMRDVLASYLNSACTDPDKYLVDTLYRCLYQALSRTEGL